MGRKQQGQNAGKPRLLAVRIGTDIPLSTRVRSRGKSAASTLSLTCLRLPVICPLQLEP